MPTRGWLGLADQMLSTLHTVHADTDPEGRFLVAPHGSILTGLGGQEVCIDGTATYVVGGAPCNLAALMNSTSYGVRGITVI